MCCLLWSRNVNEIVSTHGFSNHLINVWKWPSFAPVATLTGHARRVLHIAESPDGQSVATGAGDETLKFWHMFPPQTRAFFLAAADTSAPRVEGHLPFDSLHQHSCIR